MQPLSTVIPPYLEIYNKLLSLLPNISQFIWHFDVYFAWEAVLGIACSLSPLWVQQCLIRESYYLFHPNSPVIRTHVHGCLFLLLLTVSTLTNDTAPQLACRNFAHAILLTLDTLGQCLFNLLLSNLRNTLKSIYTYCCVEFSTLEYSWYPTICSLSLRYSLISRSCYCCHKVLFVATLPVVITCVCVWMQLTLHQHYCA